MTHPYASFKRTDAGGASAQKRPPVLIGGRTLFFETRAQVLSQATIVPLSHIFYTSPYVVTVFFYILVRLYILQVRYYTYVLSLYNAALESQILTFEIS